MLKKALENVIAIKPLVHNITNYVTINDCANILLASGASPIMADDPLEAEDITGICRGLNINAGTLNENTIKAMNLAAKRSMEIGNPIILDPVGVGASKLRNKVIFDFVENIKFSVIRGNISEIKTILNSGGSTSGVDANESDLIGEESYEEGVRIASELAKKTHAVVVITGEIDIVSNGEKTYLVRNGHEFMTRVTGTGCMLSSLIGGYISANRNNILEATLAAVCLMGVAGEIAYELLQDGEGNSTYRNRIIDSVSNITGDVLEKRGRYELVK
ncbi:MAG: hydroxyethylthiazole kinase [Clostridium sp.]